MHQRFWSKVDRSGGRDACWPWTGYVDEDGYGRGGGLTRAHRRAYELENGPLTAGLQVDHQCHRAEECAGGPSCPHRRCCNPGHLVEMTARENVLRGAARAARNSVKTACVHGHEFTPANTMVTVRADGSSRRTCRRCHGEAIERELTATRGQKAMCSTCGEHRAVRGMRQGVCAGCCRVAAGLPRGGVDYRSR